MKRKHRRMGKNPTFRTFSQHSAKPQSHRFLIGALLFGIAVIILVNMRSGTSVGQATISGISSSCHDSDGGLAYDQRGTVSGKRIDGVAFTGADVCNGSMTVLERYCDKGVPAVQPSRCLNGCVNGACR